MSSQSAAPSQEETSVGGEPSVQVYDESIGALLDTEEANLLRQIGDRGADGELRDDFITVMDDEGMTGPAGRSTGCRGRWDRRGNPVC